MNLEFVLLTTKADKDIPNIISIHQLPEISRFVSIDMNNYFDYVTQSPNVYFYKVFLDGTLVATTHFECLNKTLYMSIVVFPKYYRKGIGTNIIKNVLNGNFPIVFDRIEISIDETNIPSKKLFEKMGFVFTSKEEELENYVYIKP